MCACIVIFSLLGKGAEKAKCPDETRGRRASDTHEEHMTLEIGEEGCPSELRGLQPLVAWPLGR